MTAPLTCVHCGTRAEQRITVEKVGWGGERFAVCVLCTKFVCKAWERRGYTVTVAPITTLHRTA